MSEAERIVGKLTEAQRRALPKSPLFWARRRHTRILSRGHRRILWAKFRNANAMFVWLGPVEIGWRMPWLERSARQLHPHLFGGAKAAFVEITPRDQSVRYRQAAALGWVHNAYSQTVEPAWSTGVSHGRGNHTGDGGSQGRGRIYRTRAEAALAMRWEMCRAFAAQLRAVDLLIAKSSASSPNPDTSK